MNVVVVAARCRPGGVNTSKLTLRMYDALQHRDDRRKIQAACRKGKYGRRHGDQLEQVPPAVKSPVPAFASLTRQHSACSSAIQTPSDTRTIEASFGCLVPRAHPSTCASRLIPPPCRLRCLLLLQPLRWCGLCSGSGWMNRIGMRYGGCMACSRWRLLLGAFSGW